MKHHSTPAHARKITIKEDRSDMKTFNRSPRLERASSPSHGPNPIIPRRFTAPLRLDIPRHWLPGNPFVSSILNAYTVLVPANEAFYIRTLLRCMPRIKDDALRAAAADFIHQEAQHGIAHKRYWSNLDAQGYRFRIFEKRVDSLAFKAIERIAPMSLRVSLVSCVEHINAYVGHEFLSQRILAEAHPKMRALMEWHFAEEIEHKHVAYDVLSAVSPGYPVRLMGFLLAAPLFYLLIGMGTAMLLAQDGLLFKRATWAQLWSHLGPGHHMLARTLRHLRDYLRPGFHPSQLGDGELARAVIARYASAEPPLVVVKTRAKRDGSDQADQAIAAAG